MPEKQTDVLRHFFEKWNWATGEPNFNVECVLTHSIYFVHKIVKTIFNDAVQECPPQYKGALWWCSAKNGQKQNKKSKVLFYF